MSLSVLAGAAWDGDAAQSASEASKIPNRIFTLPFMATKIPG
jgi:hypothetical protein